MLKDVTFGQYFPANSFVHSLDARVKIVLTIGFVVLAFLAGNFISLAFMGAVTFLLISLTKVPLRFYLKTLKPILPFVLITAILNMIYVDGKVLWEWGFLRVTQEGLIHAVFIIIRIVFLLFISSMLTYTTSPTSLTDAIEGLLKPFSWLGVDTHSFAMMMTIAMRFIPTLMEETDKIMSAQKARGADMESGGLIKKIKAVLPVLLPLLISSYRRAEELADAMECRCYHGGKGRTRLKVSKLSFSDYVTLLFFATSLAVIILLNRFF